MEQADLDRARADAGKPQPRPPERSLTSSPQPTAADLNERLRLWHKAFALYPLAQSQDPKAATLAAIAETRDIPAYWISQALSKLCREAGRKFAPTVGEVRGVAISKLRDWRRSRTGQQRNPGREDTVPNAARELAYAWTYVAQRDLAAAGLDSKLVALRVPEPAEMADPT